MEETLGKRIVRCRKSLGLTQDALAERLGVTAQAVSKWENDQSCPDITTLPRLAEVFGISTDALLGLEETEPQQIHEAELSQEEDAQEPQGLHIQNGSWEFSWDGGRKSGIGLALWLLIAGLAGIQAVGRSIGLWSILWASGLLVYGLFGLYPKFSVFRLGCAVLGWYFLMDDFVVLNLPDGFLFPAFLLLLGIDLLFKALRKPAKGGFHIHRGGRPVTGRHGNFSSECTVGEEDFSCCTTFGEDRQLITLPRLSRGDMSATFGQLTVDLSGCEELAPGCALDACCTFGELVVLVPRKWQAELHSSTTFGTVEVVGNPGEDAEGHISMTCEATFGQITVRYI